MPHLEENRLLDAAAEFERLVRMAPREPAGFANLGIAYLGMGRLDDAGTAVRRALDLDPDDPDVRLILADVLLASEQADAARAELERGLESDPTHGRDAVRTRVARRRFDPARKQGSRRAATLGALAELHPGNVAARVEHVQALLAVGRADSATAGLEALRQIVPVFPVEGQDLFDAALAAARGRRCHGRAGRFPAVSQRDAHDAGLSARTA